MPLYLYYICYTYLCIYFGVYIFSVFMYSIFFKGSLIEIPERLIINYFLFENIFITAVIISDE